MKYAALFAILMFGLSFAVAFIPSMTFDSPQGKAYVKACCYHKMLAQPPNGHGGLIQSAGGFSVWVGDGCGPPVLPSIGALNEEMFSLYGDYYMVWKYCDSIQDPVQCREERNNFAAGLKDAWDMWNAARKDYGNAEKQALADARGHGCGTTKEQTKSAYASAIYSYKYCLANPNIYCGMLP